MADMSWEHASEARAALNAIVTDPDHGVAALSNAQTMSNLLKDYLPDAPREKSILVAAAEAGLADTLREHVSEGMDPDTAIRLTASSFSSSTPFTAEACNWVTDELAVALGISQPRPPGGGQAGGGFPQPQPTNQAPGQGQAPTAPQGVAAPGQPSPRDMPTAQGYRPGYAPGPQQGGFVQQPGRGYPGQQPQPQPQPYQAQQFGGQPVQPYPGQQQPQPYQPGRAYPGQPGFVQPGQAGAPAGWNTAAPYSPAGFGGPPKSGGGKRALIIAGGVIALVIVIVIVVALVPGHKPSRHHKAHGGGSPTTQAPTPTPSPSPSPTSSIEPLTTILNPVGFTPVGTDCSPGRYYSIKLSTLTSHLFCAKTTKSLITVWGYQFDDHADYLAGLSAFNSYTGFHRTSANTTCSPPVTGTDGLSAWHANGNPKYYQLQGTQKVARPGQVIECFTDNGYPLLIWTMPTMNVFLFARDFNKAHTITRLFNWWTKVNYG